MKFRDLIEPEESISYTDKLELGFYRYFVDIAVCLHYLKRVKLLQKVGPILLILLIPVLFMSPFVLVLWGIATLLFFIEIADLMNIMYLYNTGQFGLENWQKRLVVRYFPECVK